MIRARCPDCHALVELLASDGVHRLKLAPHNCESGAAKPQPTEGGDRPKGVAVVPAAPASRKWSAAKATQCGCGRRHPSKMQARVCARLRGLNPEFTRIYHEVRMPLFILAPKPDGKPFTICVDFVVVRQDGTVWKYIDAKAKGRVSRDWPARAAAFAAQYGQAIEEVDR